MTLLLALIVGAIIGHTWLEWQAQKRQAKLPDWISGVALGGLVTASLTTLTLLLPVSPEEALLESATTLAPLGFWPRMGFYTSTLAVALLMLGKRRAHCGILIAGGIAAAAGVVAFLAYISA